MKKKSNINISSGNFEDNTNSNIIFPDARRNILCINSSVNILSLSSGDGFSNDSSFWFVPETCDIEGIIKSYSSPFFIPSVMSTNYGEEKDVDNSNSSSNCRNDGDYVIVTVEGKNLLPCNLSVYIMLEEKEKEEWKKEKGEEINTLECINSSLLTFKLKEEIIDDVKNNQRVSIYLIFREEGWEGSTDVVELIGSSIDSNPSQSSKLNRGEIAAIVICSIIAVIIVIVLIIICQRRRKHSSGSIIHNEKDYHYDDYSRSLSDRMISKEKNAKLEEMENNLLYENDNNNRY